MRACVRACVCAQAPKGNANLTHLGNIVDLSRVKASRHLHVVNALRFDKTTNKIESGYPNIYVVKPVMVKKGELVQLN